MKSARIATYACTLSFILNCGGNKGNSRQNPAPQIPQNTAVTNTQVDTTKVCKGAPEVQPEMYYIDRNNDGLADPDSGTLLCPEDDKSDYMGQDDQPGKEIPPSPPLNESLADQDQDGVSDRDDRCPGDDDRTARTLYRDLDDDGLGDPQNYRFFCPRDSTTGYVTNKDDSSDEPVTLRDSDDDGIADDADRCPNQNDAQARTLYQDKDADRLGNVYVSKFFCPLDNSSGYVADKSDFMDVPGEFNWPKFRLFIKGLVLNDDAFVVTGTIKLPGLSKAKLTIRGHEYDLQGFGSEGFSVIDSYAGEETQQRFLKNQDGFQIEFEQNGQERSIHTIYCRDLDPGNVAWTDDQGRIRNGCLSQ
jgi:hypothetical protein